MDFPSETIVEEMAEFAKLCKAVENRLDVVTIGALESRFLTATDSSQCCHKGYTVLWGGVPWPWPSPLERSTGPLPFVGWGALALALALSPLPWPWPSPAGLGPIPSFVGWAATKATLFCGVGCTVLKGSGFLFSALALAPALSPWAFSWLGPGPFAGCLFPVFVFPFAGGYPLQ